MTSPTPAGRIARPHGMHLVTGGRSEAVEAVGRDALELAVRTRAGDRLEPWALPSSPVIVRVLEQAAGAGIEIESALRLCVEHALVLRALRDAGVDPRIVDAATGGRFQQRLEDRDAAYARRLTQAERDVPTPPASVGLPLRLSGQLAGTDLVDLLRDADPARARAWELAALAESRTMSEWAPLAALRAQNARRRA